MNAENVTSKMLGGGVKFDRVLPNKNLVDNPFEMNDTMKLLGNQYAIGAFYRNEEVRKEISDIAEGMPYEFTTNAACQLFMLGFIHGKRAERARRKGGAKA